MLRAACHTNMDDMDEMEGRGLDGDYKYPTSTFRIPTPTSSPGIPEAFPSFSSSSELHQSQSQSQPAIQNIRSRG